MAKQRTAIYLVIAWLAAWIVDPFITIYRLNWESWAVQNGYDKLYKAIRNDITKSVMNNALSILYIIGNYGFVAFDFFAGAFGFGLVIGAIFFSLWDRIARFGLENIGKFGRLTIHPLLKNLMPL